MPDEPTTETAEAPSAETPALTDDGTQVADTPYYQKIWDPEKPGAFMPKWQESLPEDLEEYKSMLANYGDFPTLLKSHKDSLAAARTKGNVKPLTPESTPEDVAAYRKALGIPDTPYEFQKPDALPEGVEWREERIKDFGKWAQEKHLTPAQAQDALELHVKFLAEDQQAIVAAQRAAYTENLAAEKEQLRTDFGGKLDGVVTDAKRVALKYNLPPDVMEPNSDRFAGVTMLKVFSDMAKALGESQIPSKAAIVNMDPLRMATAMREKGHPKYESLTRGDKNTLDEYYGLLQQASDMGLISKAS